MNCVSYESEWFKGAGEMKSLTLDTLFQTDPMDLLGRPSRMFGMDIIESPVKIVPKLKLSEQVAVTDAFRAEFNAWLLETFGSRELSLIPPGTAYLIGNKIVMRPESAALLKGV